MEHKHSESFPWESLPSPVAYRVVSRDRPTYRRGTTSRLSGLFLWVGELIALAIFMLGIVGALHIAVLLSGMPL